VNLVRRALFVWVPVLGVIVALAHNRPHIQSLVGTGKWEGFVPANEAGLGLRPPAALGIWVLTQDETLLGSTVFHLAWLTRYGPRPGTNRWLHLKPQCRSYVEFIKNLISSRNRNIS
jgi:hypothetical protein